MKESINTAIIVGIILTIVGLIELVLFASFAYSRAFKVKNRIVSILEEKVVYDNVKEDVINTIDSEISKIGYKINNYGINDCPVLEDDPEKYELINTTANYNYCIYRTKEVNKDKGTGYYYTVISYMYFDVPLMSIKIPIKGQTKTMYSYTDR